MKYSIRILYLLISLVLIGQRSHGQWSSNPAVNTPVCNQPYMQQNIAIISDGSGGSFVAWTDRRNGVDDDVYAQHYNSAGVPLWLPTGAAVIARQATQSVGQIVPDGTGGIIVFFGDLRNPGDPSIYAQRLNSAGLKQWGTYGVAVSNPALSQDFIGVIPDGSGGAIIAWMSRINNGAYNIIAQRINVSGVVQWATSGIDVCTQADDGQEQARLVSDGAGGFIIAWTDFRNGTDNQDIYAQRVNGSGVKLWVTNGVAVCNAPGNQIYPAIVSDDAGGALIAWTDSRTGSSADIYAQHINGSGLKLWASGGIGIATGPQNQPLRSFDKDGFGGMILAWDTATVSSTDADIYAQRITSGGVALWGTNGLVVTSAPNRQLVPSVQHLSDGGAIISWDDERGPPSPGWNDADDIFAQRVSGAGVVQWAANGIAISNAPGPQSNSMVFTLANDDAIILWLDDRNVLQTDMDIYMQNVHPDGSLGPSSISVSCCPHGNISLTAETTGTTYQWQVDAGAGFINLSGDQHHSGVNSATLQMSNLSSSESGYLYRCITNGVAGSQFKLKPVDTWIGSANSDWHNPSNWSCGVMPDSNTDAVINNGNVVVSASTNVKTLTLAPSVNLTVLPGITLTIVH